MSRVRHSVSSPPAPLDSKEASSELEERRSRAGSTSTGGRAWLVARVLLLYLVSRLATLAGAAAALLVRPGQSLATVLTQWDGRWYLAVVDRGYPSELVEVNGLLLQNTSGFFPLYPLSVRVADVVVPGGPYAAAVAVALVFGATATVVVALLAMALAGPKAAERTAALLCFFPGALVLSLAYSEGVMLTAAGAALLFLHRRQWLAAGVAAALASAARPTGIVVAASCLWAAAMAIRHRRDWSALVAPALAPAGMLAFFAFLWVRSGEPGLWARTSAEAWGERRDYGVTTARIMGDVLTSPFDDTDQLVLGLTLAFAVVGVTCLVGARLPGTLNVFVAGMLLLPMLSAILGPRPRFVLAAFPIFIALAIKLRDSAFVALLALSAALTPVLLVYYTHTFLEVAPGTIAP
jgi:hypothetical protein